MKKKKDYEQLYYDALYEIKKLKEKIEYLESERRLLDKTIIKKLDLRKIIINELLKKEGKK